MNNPSGTFRFRCQSKKDDASEGAGEAGSPEKGDAEGSSDEDEGALVIDEKSEKGGNKRKVEEPTEVRLPGGVWGTMGGWAGVGGGGNGGWGGEGSF